MIQREEVCELVLIFLEDTQGKVENLSNREQDIGVLSVYEQVGEENESGD